ncbi:hypothetical protein JFX23_03590 [Schaalia cardiffensis]|uniref:hypothetical protein n=1 Tax=Schaalia cardiffensis TaxID=181487 RepID=UPI0018E70A8C|nr:hypothetical protein [Schaalia cardiffensis]MBJ2328859.1 hypothetical protein [Schaalia cardiffensis]
MLRIAAIVLWIAITVYALADCVKTLEDQIPARIPKAMWLILIIITIPSFSLGSIAWIIVKAVARAEAGQAPLPGLAFPNSQRPHSPQGPAARPSAPDDDPEFLFRLERDIQRERKKAEEERRRRLKDDSASDQGDSSADSPEGESHPE